MLLRNPVSLLILCTLALIGIGCYNRETLNLTEYKDWVLDEENGLTKSFEVKNFLLTVSYLPADLQNAEMKAEYQPTNQMNSFYSFVVKVEQKAIEPVTNNSIPFRLDLNDASVSLAAEGSEVNLAFGHKQFMPGNGLNYIYHLFFEKSDSLSYAMDLHFKVIDPEQNTVLATLEIPKKILQNLPELKSDNHDN